MRSALAIRLGEIAPLCHKANNLRSITSVNLFYPDRSQLNAGRASWVGTFMG
ncbi:hypothetical protein QM565_38140 [Geitlerinema splendidum]|nr:hypothetical protein [Geitlerinema splendidum]